MPEERKKPKRKYGWIKDEPDERDWIYHAGQDVKRAEKVVERDVITDFWNWLMHHIHPSPPPPPPDNKSVDLRSGCSPIVDQGELGSCTANALAGALAFLEIKDGLQEQTGALDFSRLFIYYNERVIEGTVDEDSGAELRDGMKTLSQGNQGACYETTWPYIVSQFAVKPPANAYTEGVEHEITAYYSILTHADRIACLDAGFPFVFGFTVYDSFESPEVEETGVVPMPGPLDYPIGGHAVMCVGYDDSTQRYLCRNSWGTGWGMAGYFTIPYAYIDNVALASDFWTIRRGTNMLASPYGHGHGLLTEG
jgi:C1A family cysteine protease